MGNKTVIIVMALILVAVLSNCILPPVEPKLESRYVFLGQPYPPLPKPYKVEIFRDINPPGPFIRVSRIDVKIIKEMRTEFDEAVPELKKQARLSGANSIIEIRERSSKAGNMRIYHVTGTGIKYLTPVRR